MALQFVIRVNKKAPPRIGVLRIIWSDKKIAGYENLGTLKGLDEAALRVFAEQKQLDQQEHYQLENYAAHLTFHDQVFNTPPEQLKREFIYVAPVYEKALVELWQLAKKHAIDFCPARIQQQALLQEAIAVEKKLSRLLQKKIDGLQKTVGNTTDPHASTKG